MNLLLDPSDFYEKPPHWWTLPNASASKDLGLGGTDTNLLQPCTGEFPDPIFRSMVALFAFEGLGVKRRYRDIICDSYESHDVLIGKIRDQMQNQPLAPLQKGKRVYVDTGKRFCNRFTGGQHLTEKLWGIIGDDVEKNIRDKSNVKIKDIRPVLSHSDILYYQGNGKFHRHRDPKEMAGSGLKDEIDSYGKSSWVKCSGIIGLHSNLAPESILRGDGNTIVYCGDQSTRHLLSNLVPESNELHFEGDNKVLQTHKFVESVQPGKFVLFPSGFLHESAPIIQLGGYKLAVKFDVWVQIDSHHVYAEADPMSHYFAGQIPDTHFLFQHLVNNPQRCDCNLCNPQKFANEAMFGILSEVLHYLPVDVINIIIGHVFDAPISRDSNLVHNHTKSHTLCSDLCTCADCMRLNYVHENMFYWDNDDFPEDHHFPEYLEPDYETSDYEDYDEPDEPLFALEESAEEEEEECNGYIEYDE